MKIDKAIEILGDSIADNTLLITLEHDTAIKLGIEALKQLKDWRKGGVLGLDGHGRLKTKEV